MAGMFEKMAIGNVIFMIGPITVMLFFVFLLMFSQSSYVSFIILTVVVFIVAVERTLPLN